MNRPSAAIIRYRARVSERALLLAEIRKRLDVLEGLMSAFNDESHRDTYWRLRWYRDETSRIVGAIKALPEPKRPVTRKRKAKALRLVREA